MTVTDTIAVTLSPASASVALGGTQLFTATISNTTNTALNWYVNGVLNGNATQGTLTGCTTVAPLTCTYTAPPVDVPSPNPAVIKVASVADPSKYKTASVTVTDSIVVTLSPSSASLAIGDTQVFTATVSNTTNTALNWYVNGVLNGNSTQGTLTQWKIGGVISMDRTRRSMVRRCGSLQPPASLREDGPKSASPVASGVVSLSAAQLSQISEVEQYRPAPWGEFEKDPDYITARGTQRLVLIHGRKDALVDQFAVEDDFHVAGTLELFEDHFVHAVRY